MPDLERFVAVQRDTYATALVELRAGCKRSHWMWFIFPQLAGLGLSETSRFFAISGLEEARAYLAHPMLGARLEECTRAMLQWRGRRSANEILGAIDTLKFASSMTLFEAADGGAHFGEALDGFFNGARDQQSLALLAASE